MKRTASCLAILVLLFFLSAGEAMQIIHQDIEAKVDPFQRSLAVTAVLTIQGEKQDQIIEPFGFFLNRNLKITEISAEDNFQFIFQETSSPAGSTIAKYYQIIPLENQKWQNDLLRLRVVYHGMIYDPLKPPDPAYGRGFEKTTGLIEIQGAYLSGATFWIPAQPDALFSFTLRTILPADYASVSQGKRVKHEVVADKAYTEWECPFPQEEVYLIAGKYVVTSEPHGNMEIMTFLYEKDPQITSIYVSATKKYLDLYTRLIGPYPYPKFALVENYWQTGFGMPSFTLLGNQVIRLPFIVETSYGHEILHNWWGNSVYVDRDRGNWSEGLTVYGADYLYKERQGPEAAREYRQGILRDYVNYVRAGKDFPLADFRARHSSASQAIGYGKAAMVFHMLRNLVGDTLFWKALQRFYRDFLFKVASWDDIFAVFQTVTNRDLQSFQTQWIRQAGAPFISLDSVTLKQISKPYLLEVILSQSPPYTLEVPIRISTEQGEVTHQVSLTRPVQHFQFSLEAKPLSVHVDPDFDIFRKVHRAELPPTLSQALGAESVLIVLPSQGDPEMLRAYNALATFWEKKKNHTVIQDIDYTPELGKDKTVWIFGNAAIQLDKRLFPEGVFLTPEWWEIEGSTYDPDDYSLVMTLYHPENPDLTINRFLAQNPQMVISIGRKIVHYGKYSFLLFSGEKNVAKGIWPVTTSPMMKRVMGK